tara:strand:- start:434 stop:658 length:225 start_codon:yes stop_codon:yes gene_type:complete
MEKRLRKLKEKLDKHKIKVCRIFFSCLPQHSILPAQRSNYVQAEEKIERQVAKKKQKDQQAKKATKEVKFNTNS